MWQNLEAASYLWQWPYSLDEIIIIILSKLKHGLIVILLVSQYIISLISTTEGMTKEKQKYCNTTVLQPTAYCS